MADELDASEENAGPTAVSFDRQIRPLLQKNCNGCHQPAQRQGDYLTTSVAGLMRAGESGEPAVVPGDVASSYLISQIAIDDSGHAEMPKDGEPLTEAEIALITRWVEQGAKDDSPSAGPVYTAENPPEYRRLPVVTSMDFSPDGRLLAVAGHHETLLLTADAAELAGRLVGLSERVEQVRFSPDGELLAVCGGRPGREGELQVWSIENRSLLRSISVGFDTLYGASWSPDGTRVAVGCADNVVRAFDVSTGEQVLFMGSHEDWPLDTAWSGDGEHIVSVGRDMSTKLTEVSTQQFIDNITSITPGALKGGLAAVAMHPSREEILVGGADGEPKIYRMVRQTKRVIGDDAQLMRRLHSLPGRVFGVAWSPDGLKAAAVSSLNGAGRLHVYDVRYEHALPAELKGILQKRVSDRKPAEQQKIEDARVQGVSLDWSEDVPTALYSVRFSPDGLRVAAAGADGVVRMFLAETGEPIASVAPIELTDSDLGASLATDAPRRPGHLSVPDETWTESAKVEELVIEPADILFRSPFETIQLLVTAKLSNGTTVDVTRLSRIDSDIPVDMTPTGLVMPRPVTDSGEIVAEFAGVETRVRVEVDLADFAGDVSYVRHVNPVTAKLGCNQGTCHGAKDGKEGFKLSLRGYDPVFDLRALADDLKSRRVNVAEPDSSLMLLKASGRVPHVGGTLAEPGSDAYAILRAWITGGAVVDDAPKIASIEVRPINPVIGTIGRLQQMRVVATYEDGSTRDVTSESFLSSGNTDVAECSSTGLVSTFRRGEAPVLARYEGRYAATTVTVMGDRDRFEWKQPESWGEIDHLAAAKWERMKITPSPLADDASFVRRVHLDLTGLPPTSGDVRAFMEDERPAKEKRAALVDRLIGSDEFVDYWTNKWADLLAVNRKFLGPRGAKKYRDWIRGHVAANTPYDEFVRQVLTASGSNLENPAASYFKVLRTPEDTMENTTHLFLATRFNCNKCHDHPFERWTQDQYYETAAFFAQVGRDEDKTNSKGERLGKTAVEKGSPLYEVIRDLGEGEVKHERTGAVTAPAFPYEAEFKAPEDATRRQRLAAWMTSPDNRYFAASYVNRIWGYLMGVGLIEPLDDIRAGNPPSNPKLLAHLEAEFIASGFDTRRLIRSICTSRVYGLSVETNEWNADDKTNYSHAVARRLPAEVLFDAIHIVVGSRPNIPGVDAGTKAIALPDAGVKLNDGFLANLGRPVRETACECERSDGLQLGSIMALVSGPTIGNAVADPDSELAKLVAEEKNDEALVRELFFRILSRPARSEEVAAAVGVLAEVRKDHESVAAELASYREEIAPREKERAAQRLADIEAAKAAVAARTAELEATKEQRKADRLAETARLKKALDDAVAALPQSLEEWSAGLPKDAPGWTPLKFSEFSSKGGAKLSQRGDLSVFASRPKKPTSVYTLETSLTPGTVVTGLKIEALRDPKLPSKGPGWSGNFVLGEIQFQTAPAEGGEFADVAFNTEPSTVSASFEQGGYKAAEAVNGTVRPAGDGWAVSPRVGKDHFATWQFKEPLTVAEPSRLRIVLNLPFNKHALGRFRVSTSASVAPKGDGLPAGVASALSRPPAEWTDADRAALLSHRIAGDPKLRQKKQAYVASQKPPARDAALVAFEQDLAAAEKPLAVDPKLARLERAAKLSKRQLEKPRLTAAQDLAWALINSPAFLFNH